MIHHSSPIVAGIDFSPASSFVLWHAVHMAAASGVPVIAVYVLDSGRLAHWAASAGPGTKSETIFKQAEGKLAALVEASGADVRMEVRTGKAAEELQRAVEENQAGLLLIAANDLSKKRLGSVASRCVRTAPCDVLVLRDWQEGNFTKIVVCTDFSPTAGRALQRGIGIATANQATLEIVHVMYPPNLDPWGETLDHAMDSPMPYADESRTRVRRNMENFLAPYSAELGAVTHSEMILESVAASSALTTHVRYAGADLVVLGTHGMSRIAGYFLGTNAENLLQEATVSVLAVRD